ncbi:DUF3307 domain-containing protein [Rubrolithibacter danxiaensis]|uniref:DUF3307 domain-containing protein n=1 Tax=Rubrolithibacter danxiaensis TaxID=3390805 RepID=UPI003BF80DE8
MTYSEELLVLVRLLLAHLLTDFILQPSSWVKERKEKKIRSSKLYFHAALTAILAYVFSGVWAAWALPVVIFFTHFLIDSWKSYQKNNLKYFLIDQLLHLLVILFLWIWIFNKWNEAQLILQKAVSNIDYIIVITAYVMAAWPLGILVGIATEKWRNQADINREGLEKAGLWIGLLERFLILTFILINQYTAVGLLIAAKSILRFSDKENTQKKTEYVLIGTLMSFAISFVIGLLVRYLIEVI